MRINATIYGLIFGALVFATGCPDDNDPKTNNQTQNNKNNTKEDMSDDMVNDMEPDSDEDMPKTGATSCSWMRTAPATLSLDSAQQAVTVYLGCDGVIEDDIIFKRSGDDSGEVERVNCAPGGEKGPAQLCEVFIQNINAPGMGATSAAGPETLALTLPGIDTIDATLRWHYSLDQLAELAKATPTYTSPKSMGSKGLGFHIKALDKDNATFFGVHAHKVLIEKDLEKQRQEILKSLEFEFGTITNTAETPAEPTSQRPNLGDGQLNYHNSAIGRLATGFEALWWGQVNDSNGKARLAGVKFTLDAKGQPTGPGTVLKPTASDDPIKTIVSSQFYNLKELGGTTEGYTAGLLHTTESGKWQLTQLFSGDTSDSTLSSPILDTFGGLSAKDVEEGKAWAGLMPRPITFDPKDANFLPVGWNAQPSAQGVAFSLIDVSSGTGELEDTVQLLANFEVNNVYVGITKTFKIMILLAGNDGQQAMYSIEVDGNTIKQPTSFELPLLSDYTPLSATPSVSIFERVRTQKDLTPLDDPNGGVILSGALTKPQRRLRIRRRIRKRLSGTASHTSFWNGSGVHQQTTTSIRSDKQPDFGVGKVSSLSNNNGNGWVCEDYCLEKNSDGQICGTTDHFRPIANTPNGSMVGLIDGKTLSLGVQSGDDTDKPEVLTLPTMAHKTPEPPAIALLVTEEMVHMAYKAPSSPNTLKADAIAFWFVDDKGKPSQPALVNFGADIEHADVQIAGMGTEVLVFFKSADGQTGNVSKVPVSDLKALIKDTKTISPYDLSKNSVSLGNLAPDGPDVQLLTNNTLQTPFGRTINQRTSLEFPSIAHFVLAYTGEGCGKPNAISFEMPPNPEATELSFLNAGSGDLCSGADDVVARGDFLGTGGEQLVTFDGTSFFLIHTSLGDFQIPEKVVMEKENDFYLGLNIDPVLDAVSSIVAEDFNADGLTDLAIDTSKGVYIAFSDGNGGTLSIPGIVPGLSTIVDTNNPTIYARPFGFGSGTKKNTTKTSSRAELQ